MSRSAIIEETKDDVSITDEDMNNEHVVDLGQVDPVSILKHTVPITLNHWSYSYGSIKMFLSRLSAAL